MLLRVYSIIMSWLGWNSRTKPVVHFIFLNIVYASQLVEIVQWAFSIVLRKFKTQCWNMQNCKEAYGIWQYMDDGAVSHLLMII